MGVTMYDTQPRGIVPLGQGELNAAERQVARGLRRRSLAPAELGLIVAAVDVALVALALWCAAAVSGGAGWGMAARAVCAGVAVALCLQALRGYRLRLLRRFWPGLLLAVAAGWGAGWLTGAVVWPAVSAAFLASFLLFGRLFARTLAGWALDFGLTERRAVVVGGGPLAAKLLDGLAANPENDIRICAIFDDRSNERSPPVVMAVPKIGAIRDLLPFARTAEIDMVIIALPLTAEERTRQIMRQLEVLPVDIRLSAYSADMTFLRRNDRVRKVPALLSLAVTPLSEWDRIAKRALDIVLTSVALLLLGLPMLAIAIAIRLDSPGPVLFRQARHGYNHKPVMVWKFRSMYARDCDAAAKRVVTKDDPRVTPVGRFLRRTSLDELPQLFNVLGGQLSLVGPRPHALVALSSQQVAFAEMVDSYAARHRMRPGITGWAQVNGWRGEIDEPEKLRRRIEHDLYYIENWSIWFDLRILLMTPFHVLEGRNAY
ncbi:undecaprenyl-phosphate glucose phosphotransferase [Paenirhodobacter sp.]|uniref:undecaprenyl-phosphate glucose phosphotransferase n=1 Tax=Paenirhodobacter sp. TaxID=1965326 RepID=UPI003B3F7EB0